MAMLKLLSLSESTPIDELCEFGGLSREAAENYLTRASNNVDIAKNLILQGNAVHDPSARVICSTLCDM